MSAIPKQDYNICMKPAPVKTYNLIFPIYAILLLSPALWILMIAGNFLVDSLVLLATLALMKTRNPGQI